MKATALSRARPRPREKPDTKDRQKNFGLALILLETGRMKQLIRSTILFSACCALTTMAFAGTGYYSGKETVTPAPVPTLCDWAGFYIGVHAGGQFGHSETNDLDDWNLAAHHHFGYSETGFNGGMQVG